MELSEGINLSEKEASTEVVISEDILKEVATETRKRSINNSGEFLIYILDNGEEQVSVRVGIGHSFGVSYSPEIAISTLKPYIEKGFRIVADYHNHPPESVLVYKEKGMPGEYAFSPSISDVSSNIPYKITTAFKHSNYPHLIGVYLDNTDKTYINGFRYNREPSPEESAAIEFDDPFYVEEEADELGIKLLASKYTDLKNLMELGIIDTTQIKLSSNTEIPSITLNTSII